MINKTVLKQVLASNQKDVENYHVEPRELPSDEFERRAFIGVRRAGKSFMLYQKMQQMLAENQGWESMLYLKAPLKSCHSGSGFCVHDTIGNSSNL